MYLSSPLCKAPRLCIHIRLRSTPDCCFQNTLKSFSCIYFLIDLIKSQLDFCIYFPFSLQIPQWLRFFFFLNFLPLYLFSGYMLKNDDTSWIMKYYILLLFSMFCWKIGQLTHRRGLKVNLKLGFLSWAISSTMKIFTESGNLPKRSWAQL